MKVSYLAVTVIRTSFETCMMTVVVLAPFENPEIRVRLWRNPVCVGADCVLLQPANSFFGVADVGSDDKFFLRLQTEHVVAFACNNWRCGFILFLSVFSRNNVLILKSSARSQRQSRRPNSNRWLLRHATRLGCSWTWHLLFWCHWHRGCHCWNLSIDSCCRTF